MKLGFLLGNVKLGGGEKILQTLIEEFFSLGHEIYVYSWNQDWFSQILPYKIVVLKSPPIGLFGKFKAFYELNQVLKANRPDCLIIFNLALAEVGTFSARFSGIPVLLSERVDPRFLPKLMIHRFMRNIVFAFATKIVFQTEDVRNFFSKRIRKKGVIIQNMIMEENLPLETSSICKKEIIAAGRLSEEKNYPMLIQGFALADIPGYKLRILGDGYELKELQIMIQKLNLENRVILEGHVDNVMTYFKDADIFVITSNHEGLPNVLIEAMAAGLACISTDFGSGGARALINNGINGLLIPVNNAIALKEALWFLVDNPIKKNEIKLNAKGVRITNNKRRIITLWMDLIKTIINE